MLAGNYPGRESRVHIFSELNSGETKEESLNFHGTGWTAVIHVNYPVAETFHRFVAAVALVQSHSSFSIAASVISLGLLFVLHGGDDRNINYLSSMHPQFHANIFSLYIFSWLFMGSPSSWCYELSPPSSRIK